MIVNVLFFTVYWKDSVEYFMNTRVKQFALFFLTVFFMGQINASLHFVFVEHVFSTQNLTSTHIPVSGSHSSDSSKHDDCQVLAMLTSAFANVHTALFFNTQPTPHIAVNHVFTCSVNIVAEELFLLSPSQPPPVSA